MLTSDVFVSPRQAYLSCRSSGSYDMEQFVNSRSSDKSARRPVKYDGEERGREAGCISGGNFDDKGRCRTSYSSTGRFGNARSCSRAEDADGLWEEVMSQAAL